MSISIERVAVIGAGTMGAAIAAHIANAGLPVLLLDIAPRELSDNEQAAGLSLDDPAVRNRIVRSGLERIKRLKPASFMNAKAVRRVEIGNLEDDLERIQDCDWVIEAIIERLDIKRDLMQRIDQLRTPGTIVTTNTSGLPIHQIADGLSDDFRRHFFGTHFFNPPRYMKLLEVIRGDEADPLAVAAIAEFATVRLGKGVVFCKDTPNFIANRILSVHGSFTAGWALEHGYSFEEVDALTGRLIGRPKTATFRLQDLVGIDVSAGVARNLYDLIPQDSRREDLRQMAAERVISGLLEQGRLGNKTGAGFYRKSRDAKGKTVFEVLDAETFDYRPSKDVAFESLAAVAKIGDIGDRLRALLSDRWDSDRGAQLVRVALSHFFAYSAAIGPDIAYDLASLDDAVRWGFGYDHGPFELWDRIGVAEMAEHMRAAGFAPAPWVERMLAAGHDSFYRRDDDGELECFDWSDTSYRPVNPREGEIKIADLRRRQQPLDSNDGASLHDLGDGVMLLEFHSKMNSIGADVVVMLDRAADRLAGDAWNGMVIGNDGDNFCVGANLAEVGQALQQGGGDAVAQAVGALQSALLRLRRHPKPVVAAVHGMALGGGAEVAMGVDRIVAHAESYIGLVEVGVGLLPAGGGLKELVRRVISPPMHVAGADVLPHAQRILETVAMAKVSTSAAEARDMGFLTADDRIVMHRDLLLDEARQDVLTMVDEGYLPAVDVQLHAAGRDLLSALHVAVWSLVQAGWASEHDAEIATRIAGVIAGGDASSAAWLSEEHFLRLELEAFVDLVQMDKTQARMRHMLETGKPLRN